MKKQETQKWELIKKEDYKWFKSVLIFSLAYFIFGNLATFYNNSQPVINNISELHQGWGTIISRVTCQILLPFLLYIISGCALICFLMLTRLTFIFLLPVVFIISGILSYFILIYNINISSFALISTVINSNLNEIIETTGITFLILTLITFIILICISIKISKKHTFPRKKLFYAFISVIIVFFTFFENTLIISLASLVEANNMRAQHFDLVKTKQDYTSPIKSAKPELLDNLTIIFIRGEAARSDHFGLNGYKRNTTPNLASEKNLVTFKDVISCANNTYESVPCLLTDTPRTEHKYATSHTSFLEIYKNLGFHTSWISTNPPIPSIANEKRNIDEIISKVTKLQNYLTASFQDESILDEFDKTLAKNPGKQLIVLDTIGSHWRYDQRYNEDSAIFKPECHASAPQLCARQDAINSYDNSIVATDKFIHNIITRLKNKNAVIIYTSDHGEFLGEDGVWQHVSEHPGKAQYHVPLIWWFSDNFVKKNNSIPQKLAKHINDPLTHENIFHSMLGCFGIETEILKESLNICNKNFKAAPPLYN